MNLIDVISHFTNWHWFVIVWFLLNLVVLKIYRTKHDPYDESIFEWCMDFDSGLMVFVTIIFMLPLLLTYEFLRMAIEVFKDSHYLFAGLIFVFQMILWAVLAYMFMVTIAMKQLPSQEGVVYAVDQRVVMQLVGKVMVPTTHYYAEVETSTMRVEIGINSSYYYSNPIGQHVDVCGYVSALGTKEYGWCK